MFRSRLRMNGIPTDGSLVYVQAIFCTSGFEANFGDHIPFECDMDICSRFLESPPIVVCQSIVGHIRMEI